MTKIQKENNSFANVLGTTVAGNNGTLLVTTDNYNQLGQLIYQYGSTYPLSYEYDSQNRKIKMTTYADDQAPAITQWLYDEPTGLLTNKVYDDGNGPSYSYYPNGKLCSKT